MGAFIFILLFFAFIYWVITSTINKVNQIQNPSKHKDKSSIEKIADKLVVRGMKKDPKVLKRLDNLNKELQDDMDELNKKIQEFKPEHKPWKAKQVNIDEFIKED